MQRKGAQRKTSHGKKVAVTLSDRDMAMLHAYAEKNGVTRAIAIRHILRENLQTFAHSAQQEVSRNQLGLFDSVQIEPK